MNPREFSTDEQKLLIKALNLYFPSLDKPDSSFAWDNASAFLAMIIPDRELAKKVKKNSQLLDESNSIFKNLNTICDRFIKKGILADKKIDNPYFYRLPIIIGEYPRHTKVINKAIKKFNQLIENYHQESKAEHSAELDGEKLNQYFFDIIDAIATHGRYCFADSLTDLINMLHGYSCIDLTLEKEQKKISLEEKKEGELIEPAKPKQSKNEDHSLVKIITAKEKNNPGSKNPFIEQCTYAINRAGRLESENSKLVVNGFGLKFGGHFDGLLTHTPNLLQVGDFYSIAWRQLSQRMGIPLDKSDDALKLKLVLLGTLKSLGMVVESTSELSDPSDYYISPFSTQPQAMMTPSSIKKILIEAIDIHKLALSDEDLLTVSEYLSQVLFRMQFNVSQALGIGADGDGAVSFSNTGRDHTFEFDRNETEWGSRFANISLHRQGPSQAYMDASKGVRHELAAAFLTETERMSQLQRSEYEETIYNALIDNLVTDLFPDPNHFENTKYKKFRTQHILTRDDSGHTALSSYQEESPTGIFKENGQTTPCHRRAGTIDVQQLPKDIGGVSERLKSFNSGNPLAARQFQYAQAMHGGVRGHFVYNPLGPDSFIADMYNGQLIKNSDGSFLPFIGVIPKNFDKEFKQSNELCASFVVRMLHSSRLMTHCPTFSLNYHRIKTSFLPKIEMIPDLPDVLSDSSFMQNKIKKLKASLEKKPDELSFSESEKLFASLFKNIVYQLRTPGMKDENFINFHFQLIKDEKFLTVLNRETFEKTIRILEINAPQNNDIDTKKYLAKVAYLKKLTKAYYPEVSTETAQKIAKLAKVYSKPLTRHAAVQDYFKLLKKNPQANLSRKQSPAMALMSLKRNQTLAQKRAVFDEMHTKNFMAGYRDPDGSMAIKPTTVDQYLDFAAKGVEKFSVGVQNDSNPLGQIITAPLTAAYYGAKRSYNSTDSVLASVCTVPLGFTTGLVSGSNESAFKMLSYGMRFATRPGIRAKDAVLYCTSKIDTSTSKGKAALAVLFIPALVGVVVGTVESILKLLYDCTLHPVDDIAKFCMNQIYKENSCTPIIDSPLNIPALPDNEPGFKIKMSDLTRDTILEPITRSMLIKKLRLIVEEIIKVAHPDVTTEKRQYIAGQLISESILSDKEWENFYEYFKSLGDLGKILDHSKDKINSQLISAVFRCFLVRTSHNDRLKMAAQMSATYKLLPEQKEVLNNLLVFYNNFPSQQEKLIMQFSEEGEIKNILNKIDYYAQKIYDSCMEAFDSEKVNDLSETKKSIIKNSKAQDEIKKANTTIDELQAEIDDLAKDTSEEAKYEIAEITADIDKLKASIQKSQSLDFMQVSDLIDSEEKKSNSPADIKQVDQAILSNKDRAHRKWKMFAIRELAHEFLSNNETNEFFKKIEEIAIFQKTKLFSSKLEKFKSAAFLLAKSCSAINLDAFYDSYLELKQFIESTMMSNKYPSNLLEVLESFANVTMNTASNKILDSANDKLKNPLIESKAIGNWLLKVYQSKIDLRSLLSQQLDQPYVHLTILRQAYIIHALETALKITKTDDRIRNIGIQWLWDLHYSESNAIKKNGTVHYEAKDIIDFEKYLKTHGIEHSPTLFYTDSRAKMKLGIFAKRGTFLKQLDSSSDSFTKPIILTKGA